MIHILNVPIEPLEERYSVQWQKWFTEQFNEHKDIKVTTILGGHSKLVIERGSFLDVADTNQYKTHQLLALMEYLSFTKETNPIVLFFHDLWFPGLINLKYIIQGLDLQNVFITGCLHAGSYDQFDFLYKKGMYPWAINFEKAIGHIADLIFVATEFHRSLYLRETRTNRYKVVVTGFPIKTPTIFEPELKQDIVVFPHRLDSEKQPQKFDYIKEQLQPKFPRWQFIKTKEVISNKTQYYELLDRSRIAVSFALQETWGIAMQEAVLLGCIPLCPERLSYEEMYLPQFLFNNMDECILKLSDFMEYGTKPRYINKQKELFILSGERAIPNMINEIEFLIDNYETNSN